MTSGYTSGNLQALSYTREEIEQQAGAMSLLMGDAAETWVTAFVDWQNALAHEANRLNVPYPAEFSTELDRAEAATAGN